MSVSGATYNIIGLLITNKRNSDAMQEEIDLVAFCTIHYTTRDFFPLFLQYFLAFFSEKTNDVLMMAMLRGRALPRADAGRHPRRRRDRVGRRRDAANFTGLVLGCTEANFCK